MEKQQRYLGELGRVHCYAETEVPLSTRTDAQHWRNRALVNYMYMYSYLRFAAPLPRHYPVGSGRDEV